MEDRLNQIAERLRQVERELADPAVYSDQQRLKNLSREQKELTPVVETFTALQQTEQAIAEAREMLSDPELRELAQEELTRTKEQRERLAEELKRLLLPRDPNDEKSVVLEIRGGVGGEEGALFAADLLRMYTMYAERRGWQLEIVSQNVTELGGVKEVCATVEGDGAWSRLKFEAGTHRVQRVPETESGGRIQTSAATVAVMPEAEETAQLAPLQENLSRCLRGAALHNLKASHPGKVLAPGGHLAALPVYPQEGHLRSLRHLGQARQTLRHSGIPAAIQEVPAAVQALALPCLAPAEGGQQQRPRRQE